MSRRAALVTTPLSPSLHGSLGAGKNDKVQESETIRLWAKILPAIVFSVLLLYFIGVFFFFKRRLQNYEELTQAPSYHSPGPLESPTPRRLSPNLGYIQASGSSVKRTVTDSQFTFSPKLEAENEG